MWLGEPPGPPVRTRRKFRGTGTGEISEKYVGRKYDGRGKWPEKAKASAPRGKHARTSSVFCIAVPPPAAPEPRILISSRRTPTRHALTLRPLAPMSHSPAPPPQISNNTNNNGNTHSSTSPAQLAHILSTVLADNETLSKDLAVARARYERAEQTLALLKPPHTSVTAASDASPPSAYPETAVRTIMDLQSHLEAEKAAREAAESRLRTISEVWLDLDRYLQASEVHLSDARAHFSQLLRDPSTKPSFNPLPAYQPHRSHQSASRAPVAASQTFPTFSQPPAAASLPARVRHRDDNTEDVPPPKRIRTDRGPRHSIEVRICQTHRVQRVDPNVVALAYTRPRTAFIQHGRNESSPSLCLPRATTFLTWPPPRSSRSVPIPLPFSNTQPKLVHISR
jgi:hypothetical protein